MADGRWFSPFSFPPSSAMPSALDGLAFDALKFGDALLGPLPWSERVSIGRPLLVASPSGAPRWAFPPKLPGGPTAAGLFFGFQLQPTQLTADSPIAVRLRPERLSPFKTARSVVPPTSSLRSGAEEHEPDDAEDQYRQPG